jgi:hypothetical protein
MIVSTDVVSTTARTTAETSPELMLDSTSRVLMPVGPYVQRTILTIEIPLDEVANAVSKLVCKNCKQRSCQ